MRALVPELPRGAWTLVAGDAVSGIGSGLTLPFLLVYLHQVRGFGLGEAGLALSMVALAGFAGNPVGGSLVDRVGGRAALIAGLAFSAAGSTYLAFVTEPWQAYAAAAALIVDTSSAGTFQAIYVLDAASFLAFVPILMRVSLPATAGERARERRAPGGYREIFRDRAFRRLWALTALIVGFGYAQYS